MEEYAEYGTKRGYFETGVDATLMFKHPSHRGPNVRLLPTWDEEHFTPRDFLSSTDMKGPGGVDRSVIYAEDEMQKIMGDLGREVCNFDTHTVPGHRRRLQEVGQGHINKRVHEGTPEGDLLEKASAAMKAAIEAKGGSFTNGMNQALKSQCRQENTKAFGDGSKMPPLHVRFLKKWFSPSCGGQPNAQPFQDILRDAPELLIPRCALFEAPTFAEKQQLMRDAIQARDCVARF